MSESRVAIREGRDVVAARAQGREIARRAGLGLADQTRLATAISEIARNVVQYAGFGECVVRDESDERFICVSVEVVDHGPGIDDVDLAMTDGYSTGKSLGAGLPGARRITNEFEIQSRPGYTCVSFRIKKPRQGRSIHGRTRTRW